MSARCSGGDEHAAKAEQSPKSKAFFMCELVFFFEISKNELTDNGFEVNRNKSGVKI
ncbi:hypothetical protein GCM10008027_02260 [Pseudoalteromonas gelatinilytica]|uniref:Uncharacterized protein n=1 Tax=Pseudoalteromonas gelatinilytica TaxID=1703256 RepID=A0ABQ1T2Q6_9GAMM|nr:hypothetical protein GCM10008027_02260 [Pseudoalteromonas profundi]